MIDNFLIQINAVAKPRISSRAFVSLEHSTGDDWGEHTGVM
jgi:hypothetical protein